MRQYRYYSNINWGDHYNPKTKAHHYEAEDFYDFSQKTKKPHADTQATQVLTGAGWEWVTEVPTYLGGISKQWHGEKI